MQLINPFDIQDDVKSMILDTGFASRADAIATKRIGIHNPRGRGNSLKYSS